MSEVSIGLVCLFVVAAAAGIGIVAVSAVVGRRRPTKEKLLPYECGLDPTGSPGHRFSVKFFLVAVLFILFEVGIVFLYPWSLTLNGALRRGLGAVLVVEMAAFLGLIALALLYTWGRGALEWEE